MANTTLFMVAGSIAILPGYEMILKALFLLMMAQNLKKLHQKVMLKGL